MAVRVVTQASELVHRLRMDLLNGELVADQPLRLTALRARYDAGLTPLREALFQLVAEGLVTVEDQRGFRAASMSTEGLHDLTEQRVFIESQALRLAISRGDLSWESRVLAAHHRLTGTPMLDGGSDLSSEWTKAHRDFHGVLLESCGSPWLLRFREILSDHADRYRRFSVHAGPDRDVAGEHRALADAVLARDADQAVRLLHDHYWRTAALCQLPGSTRPS